MTITADIKKELLMMGISANCKKSKSGKSSKVIATVKADSFKTLVEKEQELLDKGYGFEIYGKVTETFGHETRNRGGIFSLPSEATEIYTAELTVFAAY